jgi:hypothetical protein
MASSKKTSFIKVDPRKKAKMKVSASAIQIAKETDDPIYKKYSKIKKKMFKLRKLLVKRYGPRAMSKLRKSGNLAIRSW